MKQPESSVVKDIIAYMQKSDTPLGEWYVGITEDPQARVFEDHGVNKEIDYWIYRECFTANAAWRVKRCFIATYETDGGSGGGDDRSRFVYAYKKESHTREAGR